jgi:hypothetical protein
LAVALWPVAFQAAAGWMQTSNVAATAALAKYFLMIAGVVNPCPLIISCEEQDNIANRWLCIRGVFVLVQVLTLQPSTLV